MGTFDAIVHWPTTIILFLICCILNCHGNLFFSQILNIFCCGIFKHIFFAAVKEIHRLWLWSTTTSVDTKSPLPQHRKNRNTDQYWGSEDRGEVDIDSDVNHLASSNIRQYNNVPSQCDIFTWTWTWRLLYFDRWYHLEKRPGIV